MHPILGKLIQIVAILTATSLSVACAEPCLELSTRLCKCEETDAEKQICIQLKSQAASLRETNTSEMDACDGLLERPECGEEDICSNKSSCGISELNVNAR